MVTVKDRVFTAPTPAYQWLVTEGRRTLPALGLLALHAWGITYAVTTLERTWSMRLFLRLVWQRGLLFHLTHIPSLVLPVGIAAAVLLGGVDVGLVVWRWWRRKPVADVGLRARMVLYVAMACLWFNAFVLSTPEAFSGPFRVRYLISAQISVALAYGLYVAWSLLLPATRRVIPRRVARALDVFGMNIVIILVLAELSLRVVAMFWSSPLLITSSTPSQIRRDSNRQAPGSLRFGFPMNSGGHYDTEFVPKGASRRRLVVSIGDSFSYGAVPHYFHFTTVAERLLNGVDIYNMGYPGTGPEDYLYLLENQALPLNPDLIVIQLFMGNDLPVGPSGASPPRWCDADRYLLAIVWFRLGIMRRAHLVNAGRRGSVLLDSAAIVKRYPWVLDPQLEQPHLNAQTYLQLETRNALEIAGAGDKVYARFFGVLSEMRHVAGNIPVAFVVIPDEFQVEDGLWAEIVKHAKVKLDRDLPQSRVVPELRKRGWPVVDLLPLLRAVKPMADGRRHLYALRDTHFNTRGNAVAGRALAHLVDSLLGATPTAGAPPPPLALPLHLNMGDSTARRWMLRGWYPGERQGGASFAWSDGTRSVLRLPLAADRDLELSFVALPFSFRHGVLRWRSRQQVSVVVNGKLVHQVRMKEGMNRYSVVIPATDLVAGEDVIEFRYAYARMPKNVIPGSGDMRQLAVAWYAINLAPVPP